MRAPIANWYALPTGYRFGQVTAYSSFHLGIDKGNRDYFGVPIHVTTDCTVVQRQTDPLHETGLCVHFIDAFGNRNRYMHLDRFEGMKAQYREGDVIGYMDSTGLVFPKPTATDPHGGSHLHWDVSNGPTLRLYDFQNNFLDPERYLKDHTTMLYDDHIIRNRDTGSFAYVKGGKKQPITPAGGSLPVITFLDRLPSGAVTADWIVGVDGPTWDGIPSVPAGTFFP